jgi:hypothetical protein
MSNPRAQTPLTEQQARSLAHWWGGAYQHLLPVAGDNRSRHGVVVSRPQGCRPGPDLQAPIRVFSREEAQEMENRRGFQEAASPDWVG